MANVVVADDDAVSALVIARALGNAGHQVTVARSGIEALESLRSADFDALVTDWMMPELDGLELIRKVHLRFSPAPVTIMVTALDIPQAREHALASGADDFLAKPVKPREVVEVLERCLALRAEENSDTRPVLVPFEPPPTTTHRPLAMPLVVIGANAGGPAALRILFRGLPPEASAAAFVIAQHAQPQMIESFLPILQRETGLKVVLASHGQPLAAGTISVAPGGRHVCIAPTGRTIEINFEPEENHVRPAADPLFTSAATAYRSMSVAVVLTGMGRDASVGASRVRAAGGTVLVATPGPHVASGMADSVIRAGLASHVVPLDSMGLAVGRSIEALTTAGARALVAG